MKKRISLARKLNLWRTIAITSTSLLILIETYSSFRGKSPTRPHPVPTFRLRWDLGDIVENEGMSSGVQLGVERGIFSAQLLDRWQSCKRFVLVDLWAPPYDFQSEVDGRLVNYTNVNIETCKDRRASCADKYRGEQFDFIYIDGRHDYKGVSEDLEQWWPLLRPGGIFAGHDYLSAADVPDEIQDDWSINYDGTVDALGRAAKGAVDEFANKHSLQLTISYKENPWSTWALRKPL